MEMADSEFLKGMDYLSAARRLETRAVREEYETAVVLFGLAHDFRGRGNALMMGKEGPSLGDGPSPRLAGTQTRQA